MGRSWHRVLQSGVRRGAGPASVLIRAHLTAPKAADLSHASIPTPPLIQPALTTATTHDRDETTNDGSARKAAREEVGIYQAVLLAMGRSHDVLEAVWACSTAEEARQQLRDHLRVDDIAARPYSTSRSTPDFRRASAHHRTCTQGSRTYGRGAQPAGPCPTSSSSAAGWTERPPPPPEHPTTPTAPLIGRALVSARRRTPQSHPNGCSSGPVAPKQRLTAWWPPDTARGLHPAHRDPGAVVAHTTGCRSPQHPLWPETSTSSSVILGNAPLDEARTRFVVEGLTIMPRGGGRVVKIAVLVATGVSADGYREMSASPPPPPSPVRTGTPSSRMSSPPGQSGVAARRTDVVARGDANTKPRNAFLPVGLNTASLPL